MPAYILNIQTALRPPKNIKSVANQISQQLGNLNIGLNPASIKQLAQAQVHINGIASSTKKAASEFKILGKAAAETFQRFAGFTIILTQVYALIGAVKSATSEAIDFEKELIKIKQVSGASSGQIRSLADETTRLSTSFGVSSKELLKATQVFAQAGLSIKDTQKAMEALALSDVSPTFENMTDTAEGLVAVMAQFKKPAGEFKNVLESIDAVSAKFAVESEDLITAVRRTGGAFEAAGGSLNELLALFTSVRATTRESAESIATGLRTIFARIQRPRTKTFLQTLGIETFNGNQFKGPKDAIEAIGIALSKISKQDIRFAAIVEELGGIRQLSKVIPLIKEFTLAQEALIVAETSQGRLTENARIAQESLANQIAKTKEEFLALFRTLAGSNEFKTLSVSALATASAFAQISKNLTGMIPLVIGVGAALAKTQLSQFGLGFGKRVGIISGKGGLTTSGGIAAGGLAGGLGLGVLSGISQKFNLLDDSVDKVVQGFSSLGLQLASTQFLLTSFAQSKLSGRTEQLKVDQSNLANVNSLIPDVSRQRDIFLGNRNIQNKRQNKALSKISQINSNLSSGQGTINVATGTLSQLRQDSLSTQSDISLFSGALSQKRGVIAKLDAKFGVGKGAVKERTKVGKNITQLISILNGLNTVESNRQLQIGQQSDLVRTLSSSQNNLVGRRSRLETIATISGNKAEKLDEATISKNVRLKELEERKDILKKRTDATNKLIRQTEFFTAAVSVASVALEGLSQIITSDSRVQLGQGNSGAKGQFKFGSALSLAATGASSGAFLGTIIPGVGTAVGAGIGGTLGFGAGLILGAKEAERILENVRFEKAITELEQKFKSISSGEGSGIFQAANVTSQLSEIRQSLKEAGPQDKSERIQNILNLTTGLTDFLSKTAQSSSTLQEFNTTTSEAIQFLSDFTHVPVEKLNNDFGKLINKINQLDKINENFIASQERSFERLNEINSFVAAIHDATDNLAKFDSAIENIASFASGGVGSTLLTNNADILRRGASTLNTVGFNRAIAQTTSPFGAAGARLAGEASSLSGASQVLPSILLRLSKKDPFGQNSGFIDNLKDELKGLPSFIQESIINQAEQIIGAEEKDQKIIEEIQHNVVEVSQKLLSGLKDITEPLADIADQLFKASESVLRNAQARTRAEEAATGFALKSLDLEQQRQEFIAKFNNTHVRFGTNKGIDNARQSTILGKDSFLTNKPREIFGAIGAIRSSIKGKEADLSVATEISTRHRLIDEIESERDRLGRLNKALDFLADGASRAAPAIAEFERLRGLRETRKDFFDEALFGDKESRRVLRGAFLGVSELKRTGGDINSVPDSFKGATLSLLTRFLKDRFSGATGEEILNATRVKSGSLVGFPGGAEASAATEAEKKLAEAKAIEEERSLAASKDARDISVAIQANTADTVRNLEILIKQGQAVQLLNTQSKLIAEKQGLAGPIGLRNRASQLTGGVDLNLVKQNLSTITELKAIDDRRVTSSVAHNILSGSDTGDPNNLLRLKGVQRINSQFDTGVTAEGFNTLLEDLTRRLGKPFADAFKDSAHRNLKFDQNDNIIKSSVLGSGVGDLRGLLLSELQKLDRQGISDAGVFDNKRAQVQGNLGIDPLELFDSLKELEEIFNILPKDFSDLDKKSQDASKSLQSVNEALNSLGLTGEAFRGAGMNFSKEINNLAAVLQTKPIPSEISMSVNHKVEVILNGGEVLAAMGPQLSNLAVASATKEINRMIRDKFPDVGELAGAKPIGGDRRGIG